jgi:hypothetical protein
MIFVGFVKERQTDNHDVLPERRATAEKEKHIYLLS